MATFNSMLKTILSTTDTPLRKALATWMDKDTKFLRHSCSNGSDPCGPADRVCHFPSHVKGDQPTEALFELARLCNPSQGWEAMGRHYRRSGWTKVQYEKLRKAYDSGRKFSITMLGMQGEFGGEAPRPNPVPPPAPKPEKPKPVKPEPKPQPVESGDPRLDALRDLFGTDPRIDGMIERLDALESRAPTFKGHEFKLPNTDFRIEGTVHDTLPAILESLLIEKISYGYGPAGSGKSYMGLQLAEALAKANELDSLECTIQSVTLGTSESEITGWLLPVGDSGRFEYVPSAFVDAYVNGGLFVADEFDSIDPTVAVILNNALANGHMLITKRLKERVVKRHPHFYFLALGNTLGQGPDALYTARDQLDRATRDRFAGHFHFVGYDGALEEKLAGAWSAKPDVAVEALTWCRTVRQSVEQHKLRQVISMRSLKAYCRLRSSGHKSKDVRKRLLIDWSVDEINKLPSGSKP